MSTNYSKGNIQLAATGLGYKWTNLQARRQKFHAVSNSEARTAETSVSFRNEHLEIPLSPKS